MAEFIRLIIRRRLLVGLLLVACVAAALYSSRSIESRFQYRDFYDYPANPRVALFKQDNAEFGDPAGYVIALLESDDVFRPDVLGYIQALTRTLESRAAFVRVRSLSNVNVARDKGDEIVSGPLFDIAPTSAEAAAQVRQAALGSALLHRRIVAPDGKAAAILAEMRTPASFATIEEQREALEIVKQAVNESQPPSGVSVKVSGAPAVEVVATDALNQDQARFLPFVLLVLLGILFVTFRSWVGIVLCLSSVFVATVWTFGVFALFGRPLDVISSVVPTTLLVYGVVDPIFVLARVWSKADAGKSKLDAIVEAFSELALPCFLTSLTTSLGFAAFALARAPMVRYFGITVGIGVLLAWVTTVTVLPLLISIMPWPKRKFAGIGSNRWIDAATKRTWQLISPRVGLVAAAALVLVSVSGFLSRNLIIDNTYIGDLPEGEALTNVRALEKKLSGVVRLIVHLDGPLDSMKEPEVLKAIERIDRAMEQEPMVTSSSSLADIVAEANVVFSGDESARHVATTRSLNAQFLALIDPLDRADFVTADYSKSHIALLLEDRGTAKTRELTERLERLVAVADFPKMQVQASLTGTGVVANQEVDELCRELMWGFVSALGVIILLEWLLLRSIRLALISVLPNAVPVCACFVTLLLLKHPLSFDAVLVLCISVGGLFNTTIHLASRVRSRVALGHREPEATIEEALRTVGPSSLFTTLTLAAGFSVLMLSTFPGLRMLGLLLTVTLLSAFLADMVITPALLRLGFDWKKAARQSVRPAAEPVPAAGGQ